MNIQIKLMHPMAQMPTRSSDGASGFDLYAIANDIIPGGHVKVVTTGVSLAIPDGFEAQVRPRSGMALRKGLVAILGTIDADYRGEVGVILHNTTPYPIKIEEGDRIAQLVFAPVAIPELVETDTLPETQRGKGGFGSTGQ